MCGDSIVVDRYPCQRSIPWNAAEYTPKLVAMLSDNVQTSELYAYFGGDTQSRPNRGCLGHRGNTIPSATAPGRVYTHTIRGSSTLWVKSFIYLVTCRRRCAVPDIKCVFNKKEHHHRACLHTHIYLYIFLYFTSLTATTEIAIRYVIG
jgi:hypothetical protein